MRDLEKIIILYLLVLPLVYFLLFFKSPYNYILIVCSLLFPPAILDYLKIIEVRKKEKEFPDFLREIANYLEIGMSLPNALREVSKNYRGALEKDIKRMAYMLYFGIPFTEVLEKVVRNIKSKLISLATYILLEIERSGGEIGKSIRYLSYVLSELLNLEEESRIKIRASSIIFYTIIVIFAIVLLLIKKLYIVNLIVNDNVSLLLMYDKIAITMLTINSVFTGLVIGELLYKSIRYGLLHSILLTFLTVLIYIIS